MVPCVKIHRAAFFDMITMIYMISPNRRRNPQKSLKSCSSCPKNRIKMTSRQITPSPVEVESGINFVLLRMSKIIFRRALNSCQSCLKKKRALRYVGTSVDSGHVGAKVCVVMSRKNPSKKPRSLKNDAGGKTSSVPTGLTRSGSLAECAPSRTPKQRR
jgi:hypothetical protein